MAGHYSPAAGHLEQADAPERLRRAWCDLRCPVMLPGLAADKNWQGRGAARSLLKGAFLSTLQVAEIAGVRASAVQARDDRARRSYEQLDLTNSPSDPQPWFALLKDLRRLAR